MKRAALVMALTAWETYVEDRISEEMDSQLKIVRGSFIGNFVHLKLTQELKLKTFHNPNAEKMRKLFSDYSGIDVTEGGVWLHMESEKAKRTLNDLIAKRGMLSIVLNQSTMAKRHHIWFAGMNSIRRFVLSRTW